MEHLSALSKHVRDELSRIIIGQREVVDQLVLVLICGGHAIWWPWASKHAWSGVAKSSVPPMPVTSGSLAGELASLTQLFSPGGGVSKSPCLEEDLYHGRTAPQSSSAPRVFSCPRISNGRQRFALAERWDKRSAPARPVFRVSPLIPDLQLLHAEEGHATGLHESSAPLLG